MTDKLNDLIDKLKNLIDKFKDSIKSHDFWASMLKISYLLIIFFLSILFIDEYFVTFTTVSLIAIVFTIILHFNPPNTESNTDDSECHRQQSKILIQELENILESFKEVGITFNGINKFFPGNNWYYDDGICVYTYEVYKSKSAPNFDVDRLEINFSNILENHLKNYLVKGVSTPYYKNLQNGLKVKTIDLYGIKEYPDYYEVSMIFSNDRYIQKLLERENFNLYDKDF